MITKQDILDAFKKYNKVGYILKIRKVRDKTTKFVILAVKDKKGAAIELWYAAAKENLDEQVDWCYTQLHKAHKNDK